MKVYPLKSMDLETASNMQFKLIDAITKEFSGTEILTRGDLGVHGKANIPQTTLKVERVLADFFGQEAAVFVRGSGTAAIREALAASIDKNGKLLVHNAPIYSTTDITLDQLGIEVFKCDFNSEKEILDALKQENISGVLIQYTRQSLNDAYDMAALIELIKNNSDTPIVTDDNYSVMKVKKTGAELGANLSCFSTFKLLGPEGIGCVIGDKQYIDKIRHYHYSGGSQTQGFEALEVLRGMTFAPVTHALQAIESQKIVEEIQKMNHDIIDKAVIVNAQSKVILVRFKEPISEAVLVESEKLGAAPHPIGAESKYELVPMFYRLSKTMRDAIPDAETHWIRINPMRGGKDTVIRILVEAIERVV